jgi:hypothetical protein
MNHYGVTAQQHWARWLPSRYAKINDPDSYFSTLGQEAAHQIEDLAAELAGSDPPGEDYLTRAGRLTTARLQAEEIVLPELILLPPEPEAAEDSEPDQPAPAGRPMVIDRGHPLWEQVNAEQQALRQDS